MNDRASVLARTQTLILAGGQGERLYPLTVSRPKPAVSFGGMFRIIDFTLSNCLHSGLDRVSLLTQYRYEDLHRYVRGGWSELWKTGKTSRSPLQLLPPTSGNCYRGTADAVFQNCDLLESDDSEFVLVLSGDHIYHMDYGEFLRQHAESGAELTLATVEHPIAEASQFGVVEVDRSFKVTGFDEKPRNPRPLPIRPSMALVSMGIYVFTKHALLESLRRCCETGQGYDFGHHIIPALIPSGRTYAYDFRNDKQDSARYWRDIGTLDAYYKASMDAADPEGPFDPWANDVWPSQPTRHPFLSERAVKASLMSRIGKACVAQSAVSLNVELGDGVAVTESILMPGVRVGNGARLRRTIVEEGVQIPPGYQVGFDAVRDGKLHTVTESGVVVVSRLVPHTACAFTNKTKEQYHVRISA